MARRKPSPSDPRQGPPPEVIEPLKAVHEGRTRFHWRDKEWVKRVGDDPVAERLDAEGRFEEAVARLKSHREQQGGQGR